MATYRVTGPHHRVLGHEPGEEFEAELGAVQEERLIRSGHLERLTHEEQPEQIDAADTPAETEQEGD